MAASEFVPAALSSAGSRVVNESTTSSRTATSVERREGAAISGAEPTLVERGRAKLRRMRASVLASWVAAVAALGLCLSACANGILAPDLDAGGDASSSGDTGTVDAHPPNPDGGCNTGESLCYPDGGKPICTDTKADPNHCGTCTTSCIPPLQACTTARASPLRREDVVHSHRRSLRCGRRRRRRRDFGSSDRTAPISKRLERLRPVRSASCGTRPAPQGKCTCTGGTQTFNYTGSTQTFVVPCGTTVTITAYGGAGANAQDEALDGARRRPRRLGDGNHHGHRQRDALHQRRRTRQHVTGAGGLTAAARAARSTAGSELHRRSCGRRRWHVRRARRRHRALEHRPRGCGRRRLGSHYCNGTCVPCGCGGGNGGGGGATGTAGGAASACGYGYPGSNVNGGRGGSQSAGGAAGTGDGAGSPGLVGSTGQRRRRARPAHTTSRAVAAAVATTAAAVVAARRAAAASAAAAAAAARRTSAA